MELHKLGVEVREEKPDIDPFLSFRDRQIGGDPMVVAVELEFRTTDMRQVPLRFPNNEAMVDWLISALTDSTRRAAPISSSSPSCLHESGVPRASLTRPALPVIERIKWDTEHELYHARPECDHYIYAAASGVKCARCPGWYCA